MATSLLAKHVHAVCLVYDHNKTTGNSWNEQAITQAFFERIAPETQALMQSMNMTRICASDADHVEHPYFGHTKRYGLANVTKKGEECLFSSTKIRKKENEEKRIEKIMNWYPNVFY